MDTYRLLSIDAWVTAEGDWTWNAWYMRGRVPAAWVDLSTRRLLRELRSSGYLSEESVGRMAVEDDGFNVVVLLRATRRPVLAIEYGNDK